MEGAIPPTTKAVGFLACRIMIEKVITTGTIESLVDPFNATGPRAITVCAPAGRFTIPTKKQYKINQRVELSVLVETPDEE